MQAVARHAAKAAAPAVGVIADQRQTTHTLAPQLVYQVFHFERAINGLAPGHGNGIVIENLVSDVHPGGNRGANSEYARVKIGAIAQVLKYVPGIGKVRLAYPGGTLPTHLGKGVGFPIGHPGGHIMAADAAKGVAAFRYPRRRIVRAPGAEMRYSLNNIPGGGQ